MRRADDDMNIAQEILLWQIAAEAQRLRDSMTKGTLTGRENRELLAEAALFIGTSTALLVEAAPALSKHRAHESARLECALLGGLLDARQSAPQEREPEALDAGGPNEVAPPRRVTSALVKTIETFMEDPTETQWGVRIHKAAGVNLSTIYDVLDRMEEDGWVESWPEPIDPVAEGRPRRQLYRLTADGARVAARILSERSAAKKEPKRRSRPSVLRPGTAPA